MWQNWKLKSESSPLGNVKHRHLPVEVLPAPTAALHGAAGQEASAQPPPAGATASLPARPASRPDPKPAVQAAAREGNSSGRQARATVIPGAAPTAPRGSQLKVWSRPAPAGPLGRFCSGACSLHVSVTCWGFGGRTQHSAHSKGTCGQGPGKSWGASRSVRQSASSLLVTTRTPTS